MKTVIILAHPNIENSKINKKWKETVEENCDDILIHSLYHEYPNWDINIEKEQKILEEAETIFFQFPLYWYSYPPLLKKWFDDVFTYGWAYGSKGKKLNNKKFGLAVSIGDYNKNYSSEGTVGCTISEIMSPFQATITHVGGIQLPIFRVFRVSFDITKQEIEESASQYLNYIKKHQS
jgi:putative NADPH-quinone reductase